MKKFIFGKIYKFNFSRDLNEIIHKSLELYDDVEDAAEDVTVSFVDREFDCEILSNNPKIHKKTKDGMITDFGPMEVFWRKSVSEPLKIDVKLKNRKKNLKHHLKKLRSIEYSSRVEEFVQWLHELILVPSCYFFNDVMPIHSACIFQNKKAILLAGTGGVGKSSALLSFRNNEDLGFISDDIAVIGDDGSIYGNMAWPKIYGYNCEGNDIKNLIFKNRSIIDKIQFNLKNKINPAKVRRKLIPSQLFSTCHSYGVKPFTLLYLVREDVDDMFMTTLNKDTAVEMSINVMESEYQFFHQFIAWEKYNALSVGVEPLIDMDSVKKNWNILLKKNFAEMECIKVSIPINMDHKLYQQRINQVVLSL